MPITVKKVTHPYKMGLVVTDMKTTTHDGLCHELRNYVEMLTTLLKQFIFMDEDCH